MSGVNFFLWLTPANTVGPTGQCFTSAQSGTLTAPANSTGVTVKMWGGGGGGAAGYGGYGYGGGGSPYIARAFNVTGGTTQISYEVGTGGGGSSSPGATGIAGTKSEVKCPPDGSDIVLTAGGGNFGTSNDPGAAGVRTITGGIPQPLGTDAQPGTFPNGGDAGNVAGGGGTGGAPSFPGNTPGGGGSGDIDYGWPGGDGSICFYWVYPGNTNLTKQTAVNNSLAGVGGTATATYQLNSSGAARRTNVSGTLVDIPGQWLVTGTASNYEVYGEWDPSGTGTTGGATPNTWLSLGTTRSFTLSGTNTLVSRVLYIQIRDASTQEVVNFCSVTIEVDSAP